MTIRRIEVLEPNLANKIAAGEVVERPASVIKELVENSLDAGASAVTVEISDGGISYMRVTDNGCGIPSEDVQKAFLRHATSKLHSVEGLDGIETLGFRGEALASISAVSRVSMRTRTEQDENGTLISIDGGSVRECVPCGCPTGTNIEVRELFYNVPARLKFLKSVRSEAAAVGDYVSRLILGDTRVSFKFINNGKPVYHSAGDGSLENAIYCVYGSEVSEHIMPLYYDDGYLLIEGFCGDESISRSTRVQQSIFVNGRYIRSQQLSYAAQRAYNTRLMVGRFPFLVLNIRISPREVDVNVHPNKLTVRFRDEERVAAALSTAVRGALSSTPQVNSEPVTEAPAPKQDVYSVFSNRDKTNVMAEAPDIPQAPVPAEPKQEALPRKESERRPCAVPAYSFDPIPPVIRMRDSAAEGAAVQSADVNGVLHYDFSVPEKKKEIAERISFGLDNFTVVGVLFDTYIIAEQGDTVFYIDQHAAHERILYEKLVKGELKFDSQLLLTSVVIKLSPTEFACLMENAERFSELGFEIEEFGPLSISVHAVPTGVKKENIERLIRDMIAMIMKQGAVSELDVVRGALIQASCKHAIKAGTTLNEYEIKELLSHYADGSTPLTCPHGRPVMLSYSKREFEKLFKRIQ